MSSLYHLLFFDNTVVVQVHRDDIGPVHFQFEISNGRQRIRLALKAFQCHHLYLGVIDVLSYGDL